MATPPATHITYTQVHTNLWNLNELLELYQCVSWLWCCTIYAVSIGWNCVKSVWDHCVYILLWNFQWIYNNSECLVKKSFQKQVRLKITIHLCCINALSIVVLLAILLFGFLTNFVKVRSAEVVKPFLEMRKHVCKKHCYMCAVSSVVIQTHVFSDTGLFSSWSIL